MSYVSTEQEPCQCCTTGHTKLCSSFTLVCVVWLHAYSDDELPLRVARLYLCHDELQLVCSTAAARALEDMCGLNCALRCMHMTAHVDTGQHMFLPCAPLEPGHTCSLPELKAQPRGVKRQCLLECCNLLLLAVFLQHRICA